jgi:hypothetical protein
MVEILVIIARIAFSWICCELSNANAAFFFVCIIIPKVLVTIFITWSTSDTIVLHDSITGVTLLSSAVPDLVGTARLTRRVIFTDSTFTFQAFPWVIRIRIIMGVAIVTARDDGFVVFGRAAHRARFSSWVPISNAQTSVVFHQGKI